LKVVEETILRQEEEQGVASAELRQLRSDLREALSLFNTVRGMNAYLDFFITIWIFRQFSNYHR
jgi:hypothetical protein